MTPHEAELLAAVDGAIEAAQACRAASMAALAAVSAHMGQPLQGDEHEATLELRAGTPALAPAAAERLLLLARLSATTTERLSATCRIVQRLARFAGPSAYAAFQRAVASAEAEDRATCPCPRCEAERVVASGTLAEALTRATAAARVP